MTTASFNWRLRSGHHEDTVRRGLTESVFVCVFVSLYLSTTLPGLTRSMTMTCLFRWLADVSVMPSVAPGDLAISTNNGPEAFATVSDGWKKYFHFIIWLFSLSCCSNSIVLFNFCKSNIRLPKKWAWGKHFLNSINLRFQWSVNYLQCILGEFNWAFPHRKRQSSARGRKMPARQQTTTKHFLWHFRNVCRKLVRLCGGLSPMMVTSYSIWNRASWPHWANTLRASLWLALCSGTPSTLRRRSPGRRVPSLNKHT